MGTFNALLFGGAHPAAGSPVSAHFDGDQLIIDATALTAPNSDQIVVSVGGVDQPQLFLNWQDKNGTLWALKAHATDDIATLIATAPPLLQPQFRHWNQRSRNRKLVARALAAGAALCVLLLVLAGAQYSRALAWIAGQIPVSIEQRLGKVSLAELRIKGGLIENSPAQQAVRSIGERLTSGSRYKYRWIIKEAPTVNAFAMPGGIVVVHSALLAKTASADELAAVLAHEVQHIERRHSLKQVINNLGMGALLAITLGDVGSVGAVIAHQMGTTYFGRDMEDEADRLGYQALVRAKIKPDGMLTFFQTLNKERGGAIVPAWISSHPETAQRIKTIQTMITQQPCGTCRSIDLDWKSIAGK